MVENCYFEFKDKIVMNENNILRVLNLKKAFCNIFDIPFSEIPKMKLFFNNGYKNQEIEIDLHIEEFEFLHFNSSMGLDKTIRLNYETIEERKIENHLRNIR